VYSVDLPTYELPTDSGAWLSGELLRGDAAKLAEIDVANGSATALLSGRVQLYGKRVPTSSRIPGLIRPER